MPAVLNGLDSFATPGLATRALQDRESFAMFLCMTTNSQPLALSDLLADVSAELPDHTRPVWRFHDNFNALLDFWLRRHGNFRLLLSDLLRSVEEFGADGPDQSEEDNLMEMWSLFRGQLDQHQQVEDGVYFPVITSMNPDFAPAFEMLSKDHEAIEDCLDSVENADDGAGMMEALHLLNDKILAHLEAEEDLIMPLVLETPPPLEFVVYDEDGNEVASDEFMEDEDEDDDSLTWVTKN